MARDEISAEVARREAGTSSIADVFSGVVVPPAGAGHGVTRAWYAANGDLERAHTTGTFVREPRRGADRVVFPAGDAFRHARFPPPEKVFRSKTVRPGIAPGALTAFL